MGKQWHTKVYFVVILVLVLVLLYYYSKSVMKTEPYAINLTPEEINDSNIEQLLKIPVVGRKLFNITLDYRVNNEHLCENNTEVLALFIVTSYFGNVESRSAMRRAFSKEDLNKLKFRRIFLLGEAPEDKYTSQAAVEDESKKFGDIVQGNFIEAYKNLTYKHIMGLQWASKFCSHSKYVVKMDDDIVVDIKRLPRLLNSFKVPKNRDFLAGYILKNMTPIRNKENKWYVSHEEYSSPRYPNFLSGWFYVTTPSVAKKFATLSNYIKYFWIDDLYVTGVLALHLRIKRYDIGKYFTPHSEFIECCIKDVEKNKLQCDILIGPNGGDNNLFYKFNKAMEVCNSLQCHPREKPLNNTCVAEKKVNLGRGDALIDYKLH